MQKSLRGFTFEGADDLYQNTENVCSLMNGTVGGLSDSVTCRNNTVMF